MTSFAANSCHNFHSMNSHHNDNDYILFPNPTMDNSGLFEMGQIQHYINPTTGEYSYPASVDEQFTSSASGHGGHMPPYTDGNHFVLSHYQHNTPDLHAPSSIFSSTSGASLPSASSSATGSPTPHHTYAHPFPDWNHGQIMDTTTIYDNSIDHNLSVHASGMETDFVTYQEFVPKTQSYVDPSLINGWPSRSAPAATYAPEASYQTTSLYPPPPSPTPSHHSATSSQPIKQGSASPYLGVHQYQPYSSMQARRPSLISHNSYGSVSSQIDGSETSEKGRCDYPDCGKTFKDLKAHRLTHQMERPEKCPITTCDYHIKGFARKYDKNRHTLTHYKGTMVCGFCPGSGSSAEKTFNRADVFKRHLTSVHAVEQTPPNSRKKTPSGGFSTTASGQKLVGYPSDATGKCSTCSATFANAQDFYEHLDDCVLRIVQQDDPAEAINAQRLAEVENDSALKETLRNNALKGEPSDDENDDDDKDGDFTTSPSRSGGARTGKGSIPRTTQLTRANANGVQKRGLTHSKGGVSLHHPKNRKGSLAQRKEFPPSWGLAQEQINMKKRVMCVFDGSHRLWKDDMMLSTENEVRMRLGGSGGNERVMASERYVTDLDVHTMRRAEGFHSATEEERGPWMGECNGFDLQALMENNN